MKIKNKIFSAYVIMMSTTIFIICTMVYFFTSHMLLNNTQNTMQLLSEQLLYNWEVKTTQIQKDLYVQSNWVPNYGNIIKPDYAKEPSECRTYYQGILNNLTYSKQYVNAVLLIDLWNNTYYMNKIDSLPDQLENYKEETDFTQLLARYGKPVWMADKKELLVMKRALYDPQTTKPIGYAIFSIKTQVFNELFLEHKNKFQQFIFFNSDNTEVYNFNNDSLSDTLPLLTQQPKKKIKGMAYYHYDDEDYYVLETNKFHQDWKLFTIINGKLLNKDIPKLQACIILLASLALILSFFISNLIASQITFNLGLLVKNVSQVKKGHFDIPFSITSNDEIGALATHFDEMTHKIQELISDIRQREIERGKAKVQQMEFEYNALQAQLNPHFLYNTLETINSLAKVRGQTEISQLICQLGRLLHIAMDKNKKMIPLSQEIKYIKDYIAIYEVASQVDVKLVIEIEQGLEEVLIPKLILQPIVENAIKHGFQDFYEQQIIDIDIFMQEQKMYIMISDNGKGMEHPNKVLQSDNLEETAPAHFKVGLDNVIKRLKLIYKDKADFSINSVVGEGTVITLQIPL